MFSILRNQSEFQWQDIRPYYYNCYAYKNSFEAHAYKHPIKERKSGKWNSIIDYSDKKNIFDSYYKASTDLSKRYALSPNSQYKFYYKSEHDSYNISDKKTGLEVCLKFRDNKFKIASCFVRYKVVDLFSKNSKEKINDFNNFNLNFTMYIDDNMYDVNSVVNFKEAMKEFFGVDSKQYKILFNNETNNIDEIINNIITETTEYLDFMQSLIKNEEDKRYYFVYNDGIEYVIKLSLLYKIKNKNYDKLYEKFLDIDINNSYKKALDECKKYIDEVK